MGGSFDRPPTVEEMTKMKSLVDQAMKDGAVGLSTGLIYLPGVFSKTDEIIELAKAGKVSAPPIAERPFAAAQATLDDLRAGRIVGRVVLAE